MNDPSIPPDWDYNPSAWLQRVPLIILALIGTGIALYLTFYQLHHWIPTVWEPFFGRGSEIILTSRTSYLLPIPDALLGMAAYLLDAISGVIGGIRRWRTLPWMVLIFGVAVGPLGLVSVMLVIFQPVLYDSWCTLCLLSAVISIVMIGPAMDEVLASLQYLKQSKKRGYSFWRTFWGVQK
ncbi:MAG: vitamin K epoxide reductase family protein [Verrucomicrobiae bacterium]|nr:vitamin K epoxide reductase family protein [Verrucomicrobiae bacterium]